MLELNGISQLEETISNCISSRILFVSGLLFAFNFLSILSVVLSKRQMESQVILDSETPASLNGTTTPPGGRLEKHSVCF